MRTGRREAGVAVRPPYLATAAVLLGFVAVSHFVPAAFSGFPSKVPPLFAQWDPLASPLLAVPLALVAGAWAARRRIARMRTPAFLAAAVGGTWALASTLAVESGRARAFHGCCARGGWRTMLVGQLANPSDYYADVPTVDRLGLRAFDARYPELARAGLRALSVHATTHPAGAVVLLWVLSLLVGRHLLGVALLVVLIGALGAIPTYAIAREVYGEEAARAATILFAASPAVLLYSATSVDAAFMTAIAVAAAALVRAPRSDGWAVGAGALAYVALALTWGAFALGPIGIGVAWLALRDGRVGARDLARRTALALAGFAAAGIVVWAAIGLNLVADFGPSLAHQVGYATYRRPFDYWVVGNVAAFAIGAGIAVTALVVAEAMGRWRERRPGFETVVLAAIVLASLTTMFKGETDHNWLFFVPPYLAVAGAAAARRRGRDGAFVPAAGAFGQAALEQVLLYTSW